MRFRRVNLEEESHLRLIFQIRHQEPLADRAPQAWVEAILGRVALH